MLQITRITVDSFDHNSSIYSVLPRQMFWPRPNWLKHVFEVILNKWTVVFKWIYCDSCWNRFKHTPVAENLWRWTVFFQVNMFMLSSQNIWLYAVTLHSLPRDNMTTSSQDMSYHCIWCPLSNVSHKNCDRWSWWLMLSLTVRVGTQTSSGMWRVVGMMWPKWAHWRPRQRRHWGAWYSQLQSMLY